MAIARQTFVGSGTWTAPAGVFAVNIIALTTQNPISGPYAGILIDSSGSIYTVGTNGNGQIGNSSATAAYSTPQLILGNLTFSQVVSDNTAVMGIETLQGKCYAWGNNASGQVGIGDTTNRSSPVLVQVPKLKFLINQRSSAYGIDYSGKMWAWGGNPNGNLGINSTTDMSVPTLVVGGLSWVYAAMNQGALANTNSLYAITSSGTLYACGINVNGQLGDGTVTPRSSPVLVAGGISTWVKAVGCRDSAGGSYAIGLTSAGVLYGWGSNANGQIGDGSTTARSSPVLVAGGLTFSDFAVGNGYVIGLTTDHKIYGWGFNTDGEVGDGTTTPRSSPVLVAGGITTWSKIRVTGGAQSNYKVIAAITSAGVAYMWGFNSKGQLGVGDTVSRSSPTLVAGGLTFVDMGMSTQSGVTDSMFGLTTTGAVYAWGDNSNGQLGDGTVVAKSSPVLVLGNLFVLERDNENITQLSVVPGTAYAITFGGFEVTFGGTPIGNNVASLVVQYEQ